MKRLIKYSLATLLMTSSLYANSQIKNNIESNVEMQVKSFENSKVYQSLKNNEEFQENMDFDNVINVVKKLNIPEINKAIEDARKEYVRINIDELPENEFTIFYFISKSMDIKAVERFIYQYEKLQKRNPNIYARVFFRGYPSFRDKVQNGRLFEKDWNKEYKAETKFGKILVNEDGTWTYELDETKAKLVQTRQTAIDEIVIIREKKLDIKIRIEIENNGKETAILIKNSPRGMLEYLRTIKEKVDIEPEGLKFQVHPWAFEKFNLEKVPAYALSYCNNKDFRLNQCKNKYLAKGEMGLEDFFEAISEDKKEYKKYYFDVIEAD